MQDVVIGININGEDKSTLIGDRLETLIITDNAGIDSDTIQITLDDRNQEIKTPPIEAEIKAYINNTYMGLYHVSEIETDDQEGTLTIYGTGAEMTGGIKAPRDESYNNIELGDLAATIADRYGLTLAINDALEAKDLNHVDQRGESDLDLLTRLVEPYNAIAKVADKKLIIVEKDQAKSVSGGVLPALNLNGLDEGVYIRGTIKGRAKVTGVQAHFQAADMPQKQAVNIGDAAQTFNLKETYLTQTEANDAAAAKLSELKRSETDISFDIPGNTDYKAERLLSLSNHRHSGQYIIQSSTHTITKGRVYTTSASATTRKEAA